MPAKLDNKGLAFIFKFINKYNTQMVRGDVDENSDEAKPKDGGGQALVDACKFDSPAVIVVGSQSSGKSSLLSRIIGADILPSAAARCTKSLTEITLIHDPDVSTYEVQVTTSLNKTPNRLTMDFENLADVNKLRKILLAKAKEFTEVAGPDAKFIDETAYVSITSKHINCNLFLVDVPGLIEIDTDDPENKGRRQIIDIISKYKQERRTLVLCAHDCNQNVDTCSPLRLLKYGMDGAEPLDPNLDDTFVILTKADKLTEADEIDANLTTELKGNGKLIRKDRVFATNCKAKNDDVEDKFFEKQPYAKEHGAKCGVGRLKALLANEVTQIINDKVVPVITGLVDKRASELERSIEAAQQVVDEKNVQYTDVLKTFHQWLRYFYKGVIRDAEKPTQDLANDLTKLYRVDMVDMFDDLFKRIVKDGCEMGYDDEDEEVAPMIEAQAEKFIAGTIAPGSDIKVWQPIMDELCKWLVDEYRKDDVRKEFLSNYLLKIKEIVKHCIDLAAGELPGMHLLLSEYCFKEYDVMRKEYNAYDERLYFVYRKGNGQDQGIVPYSMMTASVEQPKGETPEIITASGIDVKESHKTIMANDVQRYMQAFTNKCKLDTNSILRLDAILKYFGQMDDHLEHEFRKLLEAHPTLNYENVALNDAAARASDNLLLLQAEADEIKEFQDALNKAFSGDFEGATKTKEKKKKNDDSDDDSGSNSD